MTNPRQPQRPAAAGSRVPPPPGGGSSSGPDIPTAASAQDSAPPTEEIKQIRDERDEYLELAQRTKADFENYRKRIDKEAKAAEIRGRTSLARELLTVADNLERALEAAEPGNPLVAGVKLVYEDLI